MAGDDVAGDDSLAGGFPPELGDVFEHAITCEYASLTRAGVPVTVPTTPYRGDTGTLDVSTGLSYPAKAERARRNPKVCLLFADPIGTGSSSGPVVLVQGHAAVRDNDLQANTDRYVPASIAKLPGSVKGQPRFILKRLTFYYARIWIEITPQRMLWWPNRDLEGPPLDWLADPEVRLPESDLAPSGRQSPAWLEPPSGWRDLAATALRELPFADLTVVDGKGFPLCVPVAAGEIDGDEVPLTIGAGAPELPGGPACLTVHGHDVQFTKQENHTLMGELLHGPTGPRLRVERALADWSLSGNRAQVAVGFIAKGRRLRPRLEVEAARRNQPVPKINLR